MKLDLGCGKRKQEGYIGVDISPDTDADIVADLRKIPWPIGDALEERWGNPGPDQIIQKTNILGPLSDQVVDEVWCSHFFEHLTGPERVSFMNELFRVMKVGAKATFITPYYSSTRAIQDPFHAWPPVCEQSYLYFNKGWRDTNKLDYYPITADFDFTYGYAIDPEVSVKSDEYRQFAQKYYINAVMDLQIILTRRE